MADEYINLMIELDIFKNKDEKIHYILKKDFSNTEYVKKNFFLYFCKNKNRKTGLCFKNDTC